MTSPNASLRKAANGHATTALTDDAARAATGLVESPFGTNPFQLDGPPLAPRLPMDVVIRALPGLIGDPPGPVYRGRVCGRQRGDGTWEAWMEFDRDDGTSTLRTRRETTQPNLADLEHWATGLTPVYVQGAFRRARPDEDVAPARTPGLDTVLIGPVRGAVLDPFSVFLKGEGLLRRQLAALSRDHLLAIVRAYDLDDGDAVDALTAAELIPLIVTRVADRRAA